MGNPVSRTYNVATTDVGPQTPVNLEWLAIAQGTVGVFIVDGTASYSVEVTLDDLNNPDVTARWFTMPDFPAATAVTKYAALSIPFRFVRLNLSAITGTVELKVQQATMNGIRQ